jgi:arsenate reductase
MTAAGGSIGGWLSVPPFSLDYANAALSDPAKDAIEDAADVSFVSGSREPAPDRAASCSHSIRLREPWCSCVVTGRMRPDEHPEKVFNALFISQRNSARAPLAAGLLNAMGKGRFRAFSVGEQQGLSIDPVGLEVLAHVGIRPEKVQPRRYEDFVGENAPQLDFVFTLSDTAAGEARPAWPGPLVTAHWRCEDPKKYPQDDPERRRSLIRIRAELERRLRVFLNLPFESLDRMSLQQDARSLRA